MADKKISQLGSIPDPAAGDQLIINDDNNTTKTISYANLLKANHRGGLNTCLGVDAASSNSGDYNTAIGRSTLKNSDVNSNTAVGHEASMSNTTGNSNTAVGVWSLRENETGIHNIAVGVHSLKDNVVGDYSTAVGSYSLQNSTVGINTAVGYNSSAKNTTGSRNTTVGYHCLHWNETGSYNTGLGDLSLRYSTGDNNTAVGRQALYGKDPNSGGSNTGTYNTAVGVSSMVGNDTGFDNTAVGVSSLASNTTGHNNTAVGRGALQKNVSGNYNVSCGRNANYHSEIGSKKVAIGVTSGFLNQGGHNAFIGHESGYFAHGAYADTHVGIASGMYSGSQHDITDTPSMSNGRLTMIIDVGTTTTWTTYGWGDSVWASGAYYHAGQIRQHNGTIYRSLSYHHTNTAREPGVGDDWQDYWEETTTAQNNDLFYTNTTTGTGDGKVAPFATYNTSLGCSVFNQTSSSLYYNSTAIGYDAEPTGSNQVVLGNSSTDTYLGGGVQVTSDERDKADIEDTALGLDFISALTPRQYRWDSRSDYYETTYTEEEQVTTETDPETGEETTITETVHIPNKVSKPRDGSKKRTRLHQGLIAQEVKQVMDDMGIDFAGYQDHTVNGGADQLTLGYSELIAPMIKAIQELKARIEVLEGA